MILTELKEEELKEQEDRLKKEFKFISSKLLSILFYFSLFFLVLIYLFLLSQKTSLERKYSDNNEVLRMIRNEISIYQDLITTYSSIDHISRKLGLKELFFPREIWYIYGNDLVNIGGSNVDSRND